MSFFEDLALIAILRNQINQQDLMAQQAAAARSAATAAANQRAAQEAAARERHEQAIIRRGQAAYDAAQHFGSATPAQFQDIREAEYILQIRAEREAAHQQRLAKAAAQRKENRQVAWSLALAAAVLIIWVLVTVDFWTLLTVLILGFGAFGALSLLWDIFR